MVEHLWKKAEVIRAQNQSQLFPILDTSFYTTHYRVSMKFSSLYQNEDFGFHFLSAEKL